MKRIYLFSIITYICLFLTTSVYATDNPVTLGNVSPNQLRIQINSGGSYCIYRWIGGGWQNQFYAPNSHLFAIKIGNTVFTSGGNTLPEASEFLTSAGVTLTYFQSIEDVGIPVTSGVQQEMTKKFTGFYNGQQFSVTLKITYNISTPDYLIKHATIDATNIPSGTPIILAYGWDTFVNIADAGFAYILPDIFGLNDNPSIEIRYLTTAQVQSLRLVGASNSTGNGALIAFFPIGRNFDRAYSSTPYNNGYCFNIPNLTPGNGTSVGDSSKYMFQFGPFAGAIFPDDDNGQGVGYDNIPAGQVTEIKTGLTFTTSLDGELDYFWNGQKNLTANIGDNVNLNLNYLSYSPMPLTNVGFRVAHTGLQILSGGCSSSGFTGGISTCVVGSEFYQLTGASVAALGNASISVPVNITRAGQWVVDGNSISNMTQTLPLGSPATLTVVTTVSLADNTAVALCAGDSMQCAVKYPNTVTAANDLTVNLTYSGDISDYSVKPASVTIPAGQNSALFTVKASPTATNNATMTISLSETNQAFATIVAPSSVHITVKPSYNDTIRAKISLGERYSEYNFNVSPSQTGFHPYQQVLQTTALCDSIVNLIVEVLPRIITAFSPFNKDGINDYFMKGFKVQIFNRYGALIYETRTQKQLDLGWDGKDNNGHDVEPGLYFYILYDSLGKPEIKSSVEVLKR